MIFRKFKKYKLNRDYIWIRDNEKSQYDVNVIQDVIINDCYGLEELSNYFYPDTVVDIGAHIGTFYYAARQYWDNFKYIGIEPEQVSYKLLTKNTKGQLYNAASRYDNATTLVVGDSATGGNYMIGTNGYHKIDTTHYEIQDTDTKLITLEDILQDNNLSKIDLLKLDCEGSEFNIFKGMDISTRDKIKYIVGEYHGLHSELQIITNIVFPNHNFQFEGTGNTIAIFRGKYERNNDSS